MKYAGPLTYVALLALPLMVGCGGDSGDPKKLPTVRAGGTAKFEGGAPVTNLKVVFVPTTAKGYSPSGNLDEKGNFQLTTDGEKGAPAGKYKVYFAQAMSGIDAAAGPPTAAGPTEKPSTGPPVRPEAVVHKDYLAVDSTPLTVDIPEGGKDDIALVDVKPAAKQ
jgi:hypothetical protein